jgi:hypothetical protein
MKQSKTACSPRHQLYPFLVTRHPPTHVVIYSSSSPCLLCFRHWHCHVGSPLLPPLLLLLRAPIAVVASFSAVSARLCRHLCPSMASIDSSRGRCRLPRLGERGMAPLIGSMFHTHVREVRDRCSTPLWDDVLVRSRSSSRDEVPGTQWRI